MKFGVRQPVLTGQLAAVTGGASGIGAASARCLAQLGASVVLLDIDQSSVDRTVADLESIGILVQGRVLDVSDQSAVRAAFGAMGEGLTILVNSAGVVIPGSGEAIGLKDWQRTLAVNLTGTWLCSKYAAPLMRAAGRGSIINVGSTASLVGLPDLAAYAASKGGVALLTKAMALDLAHDNIRVNCVCPGHINTPLGDHFIDSHLHPAAFRQSFSAQHPLGRLGEAVDVAELIAFLASPGSSFMTGTVIPVDGGYSAQ